MDGSVFKEKSNFNATVELFNESSSLRRDACECTAATLAHMVKMMSFLLGGSAVACQRVYSEA